MAPVDVTSDPQHARVDQSLVSTAAIDFADPQKSKQRRQSFANRKLGFPLTSLGVDDGCFDHTTIGSQDQREDFFEEPIASSLDRVQGDALQ